MRFLDVMRLQSLMINFFQQINACYPFCKGVQSSLGHWTNFETNAGLAQIHELTVWLCEFNISGVTFH